MWQTIDAYDALKKKPPLAVFWFSGTPPSRGQTGQYGLSPMARLERIAGSRTCTHWMPLPAAPDQP